MITPRPFGAPDPTDFCVIHAERFGILDKTKFTTYVKDNRHAFIDLSKLKFVKVAFISSDFALGKPLIFDNTIFESCYFNAVGFSGNRFTNCTFENCNFADANFANAQLYECDFRDCEFTGAVADFSHVKVRNTGPLFYECRFLGLLDKSALETSSLILSESLIKTDYLVFERTFVSVTNLYFGGCYVDSGRLSIFLMNDPKASQAVTDLTLNETKTLVFSGLSFNGRFALTQRGDNRDYVCTIDLSGIDFSEMVSAKLFSVNFAMTRFVRAYIENVRFNDVKWVKPGRYNILFDHQECERSGVKNWPELVRLYVQLKKNFESERNYIDASHWFYQEMQCRRADMMHQIKSPTWAWLRGNVLSLAAWYRYISNYGEYQILPFIWLAVIWFIFGILYYLTGVPSLKPLPINAFVFSLYSMTFQSLRLVEFMPATTIILNIFQAALTAIILPLFLLALRRRYRR